MVSRSAFVVLLLTLTVVSIVSCSSRPNQQTANPWFKRAPAEDNVLFERVLEFRKNKEFQEAVEIALTGTNGKMPDDFMLQSVADTYFERAQQDPNSQQLWVRLALKYSQQALESNPADIINVFNVADSYFAAGLNMPKPDACSYYATALKDFEMLRGNPLLMQESGVVEGETVSMGPFRHQLDERVKQVRSVVSGCSDTK
jgi:hypothetical protein